VARSARLVLRVVLVPAGPGAADSRRRVADLLLRAATAEPGPSERAAGAVPTPEAPGPPGEKAA
jgi:hypothetical protein